MGHFIVKMVATRLHHDIIVMSKFLNYEYFTMLREWVYVFQQSMIF